MQAVTNFTPRLGCRIGSRKVDVRPRCHCEGVCSRRGSRSRAPWSTLLGASGRRAARSSELKLGSISVLSSAWGVLPQACLEQRRDPQDSVSSCGYASLFVAPRCWWRGCTAKASVWTGSLNSSVPPLKVAVLLRFKVGVADGVPEAASVARCCLVVRTASMSDDAAPAFGLAF